MRVLVVDDDGITGEMLENSLGRFGYEVTVAADGKEAFDLIRSGLYRLVVCDWEMPEMSGLELCRQVRQRRWSGYIYVIILTGHGGVGNVVCGLDAGADDYLTKPFQPDELGRRLRVGERVLSLEARDLTIFALAKLAESRDIETGVHLERMREYCRILAEEISKCEEYQDVVDGQYVELIYLTSPLHDIGKVGIPDRVLLKPGRLTREEFEIMKQHTVIGGNTLNAAAMAHPEAEYLLMARDIALTHHERFDGKGYPRGLSGEEIPLCGRIVALADVYDALTSKRIYKPEYSHEIAKAIIMDAEGTQFDPAIVSAFLNRELDFLAVRRQFQMRLAAVG
ncbi:MAG: response regulator [Planctomycetes bacterium]|nr:response regulator [Planctomycetia bacterium]MBI3464195.1 response regulator [Planctomycetota bacterium]